MLDRYLENSKSQRYHRLLVYTSSAETDKKSDQEKDNSNVDVTRESDKQRLGSSCAAFLLVLVN